MSLAVVLNEWLKDFLADLDRRDYSPRSLRTYHYDLQMFVGWVADQAELQMPGQITTAVLEQYQMHLMLRPSLRSKKPRARALSASARNRHLAAMKSFFRFLKRSCRLLGNPASELEGTRDTKRLPKAILTVPEVARLLKVIPKDSASGLRDWAAVELLYSTGIRRFELLSLELSALRLSEELVHVLGKGKKERVVPMGGAACQALQCYLQEGRPKLVQGRHLQLFVANTHGGPVSQDELLRAIRSHARRAGIQKTITFHLFRHTCATHLLRGGADLRSIQTLLGHSALDTTAIYTRVEVSDLKKTLRQCHPREQDYSGPT